MRVPNKKINQINILKPFFGEQKAEKTTQITVVSDLDCYETCSYKKGRYEHLNNAPSEANI
jgi:hypothetical protein